MEKKDSLSEKPLVSVIMATYNEPAQFIKQSVGSLLSQTYTNIEILIGDDSTKPETIAALDSLAALDCRVKLIRKSEKMGFVPALNECLKAAKGELLARMDGDDISLPERFAVQVAYAKAHPEVDVFGGSMNIINENNEIISERRYPTKFSKMLRMFLFRSCFAHPTVMMRRKVVDEGFFYNPEYKRAEDVDFFFRLLKAGFRFGNTEEKVLNYRTVGDLGAKRPHAQWEYNFKARSTNFIWKRPLFSLVSLLVSATYLIVPPSIVSRFYKRENSKGKN